MLVFICWSYTVWNKMLLSTGVDKDTGTNTGIIDNMCGC